MKRKLSLLLILAMLVGIFAGCSKDADKSSESAKYLGGWYMSAMEVDGTRQDMTELMKLVEMEPEEALFILIEEGGKLKMVEEENIHEYTWEIKDDKIIINDENGNAEGTVNEQGELVLTEENSSDLIIFTKTDKLPKALQ